VTGRVALRTDDLGEELFGAGVTVEYVRFGTFLVVQDELQGDAGIARPGRVGWVAAVADEVPSGG
jgi:hypothetical protein